MLELTIKRIENGYLLEWFEEDVRKLQVIQEDETDSLSEHEQLLWSIMEHFNFIGSKHDPERIRVLREIK